MTVLVFILFVLSACASRSYIKVHYQLPDKISAKPAATEIRLRVVDQRDNPDPLSAGAREKLENFRGNYMLILAPKGENVPVDGVYGLDTMFERVFQKRLDQMGIQVVDSGARKIPELNVAILLFQLDHKDYKWHFKMTYAASLTTDGNVLVTKTISGETERLDVPGVDDSGTAVSEMYADLINQLDIAALLSRLPPG